MGTYENPGSVTGADGTNVAVAAAQSKALDAAGKQFSTQIQEWSKLQQKKNQEYKKNQLAMEKAKNNQWIKMSKKLDLELTETESDFTTGASSFDNTYLNWGKGIKDNLHKIELNPDSTPEDISKAEADAMQNIQNQQEFMGFFQGSLQDYEQKRKIPHGKPGCILNSNNPGMAALYDDFIDNDGANITMNPPNGTQQTMTYHNPKSILRDDNGDPVMKDGKVQYMSKDEFAQKFVGSGEVYAQELDMSDYLKKNKNKNTQAYNPIAYQPDATELITGSTEAIQKQMGYGKETQTETVNGKSVTKSIYDNEAYWENLSKPGTWDYIIDSEVEGEAAGVWESMGNTTRWIGSGHDSVPPEFDMNQDGEIDDTEREVYQNNVQIQRNLLGQQLAQEAYKETAQPDSNIKSQRISEQKTALAEKKAFAKKPMYDQNQETADAAFEGTPATADEKALKLNSISANNNGTTNYQSPDQLRNNLEDMTDQEWADWLKNNNLEGAEVIAYKGDLKNLRGVDVSNAENYDAALNKAGGISDVEIGMIKEGQQSPQSFSVDDPTQYQPTDASGEVIEQAAIQDQFSGVDVAASSMNQQQGNVGNPPGVNPVGTNTQYDSNPDSYGAVANQSGEAEWSFGDLKIKSSDFKNGALKTDGPNGYIHKLMNFEDSAGGFDGKAVSNYGFTGTGKEGAILLGKFEEYEKQGKNKAEAAEATINEYIIGSDPTVKKDGKPTILNELNISRGDFDKLPEDTKELLVGYKMNSGRDIADLLVIASGGDWDGRKAHRGSIDKNLVKAVDVANLTPNQLESARQQLYIGRIQSMQEMVDDPKNNKVTQNQVDTATKGWLNSQQHRSNFKFPEYNSKKEMEDDKSLKPGESVFVVENGKKVKYIIQQQ